MKISDIIHYPVKALAGNHLAFSEIQNRGLKDDRRLMLIDKNNKFVSQRSYPLLSQIEAGINEDFIILKDKRSDQLIKHPFELRLDKTTVGIWGTEVTSHRFINTELDDWISDQIGEKLRFVYMDESDHRHINPDYAAKDELVSFADGYPILICNTASLEAFNSTISSPISMDHFRPNIVIEHNIPWEEDQWKRIRIGGVVIRIAKPCARCIVTNIDPTTGIAGNSVLNDLGKIRLVDNKVLFGMNAIAEEMGTIRLGDQVELIE